MLFTVPFAGPTFLPPASLTPLTHSLCRSPLPLPLPSSPSTSVPPRDHALPSTFCSSLLPPHRPPLPSSPSTLGAQTRRGHPLSLPLPVALASPQPSAPSQPRRGLPVAHSARAAPPASAPPQPLRGHALGPSARAAPSASAPAPRFTATPSQASFGRPSLVTSASLAQAPGSDTGTAPERTSVGQPPHDLGLTRVVNGMWQVSSSAWGPVSREKVLQGMLLHLDNGLTTFDAADIYGPAECMYGEMLDWLRRQRGEEEAAKAQGLTKFCQSPGRMTRSLVEGCIDKSRRNMQVNTLDMVQLHWWDYSIPGYLDALNHLTDLREEGKIRAVALTNFDTEHLQIVLEAGIPVVTNQVQFSLVDTRPLQRLADLCALTGVKLITYGVLLGGLLSEEYLGQREPNSMLGPRLTTPSQGKYKRMIDAWGGWGLFQQLLQVCKKVGDKHGASIPNVALRFILDQPCVAASMVGVRFGTREHTCSTKAVFTLELDQEDRLMLAHVMEKGRDLMGLIGDCGHEYQ